MNKCIKVAACNSRFDLKTRASTRWRSCCKHSPVQSEWHRSIHIWQWLFASTAALIDYGAPVCVEYGPESWLSMKWNPTPLCFAYKKISCTVSFIKLSLAYLILFRYVTLKVANFASVHLEPLGTPVYRLVIVILCYFLFYFWLHVI